MEKPAVGAAGQGKFLIATVKGVLHEISGKNLVDIILTNNGYEGDQSGHQAACLRRIIEAAATGTQADCIAMSGLAGQIEPLS